MMLPDIFYKIAKKTGIASKPFSWEFPREVDVGLTNFCNLRCSFCVNDKIKKKRGFMEESLFKSLADCLADKFYSKTILGLGLFGEATLHPNFVDFLRYAAGRGLKIHISTNFVNINETILREFINSKIDLIEISFYTLNKEQYNKIVDRDKYDQVLGNIHSFLGMAHDSGFRGAIRLRPFKNYSGQEQLYKKEFYLKYPNLNLEKNLKAMSNWAGFLHLPKLLRPYLRVPCPSPFSRLAVDWDGEARVCCNAMMADDLTIGYAGENNDLYDLWHGEKLNKIRDKFSKIDYKDFSSCINCYFSRRYFPLRKD